MQPTDITTDLMGIVCKLSLKKATAHMDLRILGDHVAAMTLSLRLQSPVEGLHLASDEKFNTAENIPQENHRSSELNKLKSKTEQHAQSSGNNISSRMCQNNYNPSQENIPKLAQIIGPASQNSVHVMIIIHNFKLAC